MEDFALGLPSVAQSYFQGPSFLCGQVAHQHLFSRALSYSLDLEPWLGIIQLVISSVGISQALPCLPSGLAGLCRLLSVLSSSKPAYQTMVQPSCFVMRIPLLLPTPSLPQPVPLTGHSLSHPLELISHAAPFACLESVFSTLYPADSSSCGIQLGGHFLQEAL